MLAWILLALLPTAHADECDARALGKEITTTAPVKAAKVFVELAECDATRAKTAAPKAFERILAGTDGNKAAKAAIDIGAAPSVRTWLGTLEPDQRSRTVAWLGEQCSDSESIQTFFTESKTEMGMAFWTERWHRGLADCRVAPVQDLLKAAVKDDELARDRTRLFNVLEVYARNLRGDAIPTLVELAGNTSDPEELTYMINAFADTTGIGSVEGTDTKVAAQATKAIRGLGAKLPARAVEQARITLRSLGDEEGSDAMAANRWRERMNDGSYAYAVALQEVITCKNGKTKANLYVAPFTEGGEQWPDQLQPQLLEKLTYEWEIAGSSKCTPEYTVLMPNEPFDGDEAQARWIEEQVMAFQGKASTWGKAKVMRKEAFSY